MIDCADSTTLRTHLDHPDEALDAHLDACDACAGLLRAVAADAGFTRRALALLDPPEESHAEIDVEAALAAAHADAAPAPVVPIRASRSRRLASAGRRMALSSAAAMLVLVVALTPTGRSAVADVLDAFRGERLQVVTVDTEAWAGIDPDDARALAAFGDVDTSDLTEPAEVADIAEAESVSGITAPTLATEPDHIVALAPGTARLTLTARADNDVPPELDGATLIVGVPGAIGAIYGPMDDGPPELVIGRSGPLVVEAEGAPLEDIRAFVLASDELPADLRAQLAAIGDWRSTIPVPVPLDGPGWEETEVAGRPAIAFGDDSGIAAMVLRQDPDGVTVVGGRIGISRALELAAGA